MHTFYLPPQEWGDDLRLKGDEAHHLIRVLRLRPGDTVAVLDGMGREALCTIASTDRQTATLAIDSVITHKRDASSVVLAVGWGKEARRGWILEKSVELEAEGLWFWQAERSQFPVPDSPKDTWTASLAAGAKQCRNPWLPGLKTLPDGVSGLIREAAAFDHLHVLVESSLPTQGSLTPSMLGLPGRTLCVIGPEGGFTERELQRLSQAGFAPLSMGDRILRWETASMMALGLHWWKKQLPEEPRA